MIWFLGYLVVTGILEKLTDVWVPNIKELPSSVSSNLYVELRSDLAKSIGYIVPFIAGFTILGASRRTRSFDRSPVFMLTALSAVSVAKALLLSCLVPGLLTGSVTSLRWASQNDLDAAHLNWWAFAVGVVLIALIPSPWRNLRTGTAV